MSLPTKPSTFHAQWGDAYQDTLYTSPLAVPHHLSAGYNSTSRMYYTSNAFALADGASIEFEYVDDDSAQYTLDGTNYNYQKTEYLDYDAGRTEPYNGPNASIQTVPMHPAHIISLRQLTTTPENLDIVNTHNPGTSALSAIVNKGPSFHIYFEGLYVSGTSNPPLHKVAVRHRDTSNTLKEYDFVNQTWSGSLPRQRWEEHAGAALAGDTFYGNRGVYKFQRSGNEVGLYRKNVNSTDFQLVAVTTGSFAEGGSGMFVLDIYVQRDLTAGGISPYLLRVGGNELTALLNESGVPSATIDSITTSIDSVVEDASLPSSVESVLQMLEEDGVDRGDALRVVTRAIFESASSTNAIVVSADRISNLRPDLPALPPSVTIARPNETTSFADGEAVYVPIESGESAIFEDDQGRSWTITSNANGSYTVDDGSGQPITTTETSYAWTENLTSRVFVFGSTLMLARSFAEPTFSAAAFDADEAFKIVVTNLQAGYDAIVWTASDGHTSTEASYTMRLADVGNSVQVQITYGSVVLTNSVIVQSAESGGVEDSRPTLSSATAFVNDVLVADVSTIVDPDGVDVVTYEWNGTLNTSESSYVVQSADVGLEIQVRVVVTDRNGNVTTSGWSDSAIVYRDRLRLTTTRPYVHERVNVRLPNTNRRIRSYEWFADDVFVTGLSWLFVEESMEGARLNVVITYADGSKSISEKTDVVTRDPNRLLDKNARISIGFVLLAVATSVWIFQRLRR